MSEGPPDLWLRDLWLDEKHRKGVWTAYGGSELETALEHDDALGGSPVRLIDARYLITLAKEPGGTLRRRQDLPPEAFLEVDALKKLPEAYGMISCLRIIAISQYAR